MAKGKSALSRKESAELHYEKKLALQGIIKLLTGMITLGLLLVVAVFLLCGFDFRFGWSRCPLWVSIVGCAVFLITYVGFAELLRENLVEYEEYRRKYGIG